MQTHHLISADEFCTQYNIELSFISLLHENGLIEVTTVEQTKFIPEERIPELEKMIRLHYELDINLEGIEVITHLLQKIESMQHKMTDLKNRLRLYENFRD
jgi:hypothetical protein